MKKAKLAVITNTEGRVIAAASLSTAKGRNLNAGILPLPGQVMHEIEVPEEILRLPAVDKHDWLMHHLALGPGQHLVLREKPEFEIKRHKHA